MSKTCAPNRPLAGRKPFLRSSQPRNRRVNLRVLLIAPSPAIVGGQSVQAVDLRKLLAGVPDLEVRFFPLDPAWPKPLRFLARIPVVRTVSNFLLYNAKLARAALAVDILHIFTAGLSSYSLWTIPALLFGKLYRKKLIVHYHDGRAEQHLTKWRTAKPTLAWADRIVTPSQFLVDVFARHGLRAQSIFNVIDLSRFPYRSRRTLKPVFLSNRGLEPLYNIECTLRAFRLIQDRCPEASLTIAHDGYHRPALEKLARELGLNHIRFIGRVAHSDVPALYDATDIYLMSPDIDNMPVSLLECMACGLPIVTTGAGGIPYIVKDRETALLVPVNDHEALATRALELLANDDLVVSLTSNGVEEVKRYLPEPIRSEWLALYRDLAEQA